jgi:hypothetical protein
VTGRVTIPARGWLQGSSEGAWPAWDQGYWWNPHETVQPGLWLLVGDGREGEGLMSYGVRG